MTVGKLFLLAKLSTTHYRCNLRGVYSDTTQLNSTSSCRHVHSVNNCQLSMNVVTQLTQFVGRDVINKNTTDLAARCSTGSVELCHYRQPSIATQLNSTSSCVGKVSIVTQLNSTSSCRLVHSVNNCHLSMNVVTQLTQFVGRDVIGVCTDLECKTLSGV